MDTSLNNAVQKMGSNFLVAAFTPSMAFILASYIAFQPLFWDILKYDPKSLSFLESGVILLLASTILGFTLYTIETYIYKAFEGYVFILGKSNWLRNRFLKKHRRRYKNATTKKQLVQKRLEVIDRKLQYAKAHPSIGKWYHRQTSRLIIRHKHLSMIKYNLTSYLDHNYPPSELRVMPTRFGNILCAAEMYSGRYGIDAVPLWPKLVSAIPDTDGMMEKINEANNQCQFLLNGALLGTIYSLICMLAVIFKMSNWIFNSIPNISDRNLAIVYIVLLFLSAIVARFFYEASLYNVEKYGEMIKTTFDLYRFNLLKALHLELPPNLVEEKKIWLQLSHFVTGNLDYKESDLLSDNSINLIYTHTSQNSPAH